MTTDLTHTAVHAALVARLSELNVSGWTIGSEHDPRCSTDEAACMQMCPVPVQDYLPSVDVATNILTLLLDQLNISPAALPDVIVAPATVSDNRDPWDVAPAAPSATVEPPF